MPDSSSTISNVGWVAHSSSSADQLAGRKMVKVVPSPMAEVHGNQTPMRLNRPLHDGEAEPAAARPAADKGLKETVGDVLRDARAVVRDIETDR